MREKSKKQLPLMNPAVDHPQARELESISYILDREAVIVGMFHQDRCRGGRPKATGACGLTVENMCRSQWVYNRLRRFRAGVESIISWIKRCFGFDRCTWKGRRSFESYAWLSVVTAKLITLARAKPA